MLESMPTPVSLLPAVSALALVVSVLVPAVSVLALAVSVLAVSVLALAVSGARPSSTATALVWSTLAMVSGLAALSRLTRPPSWLPLESAPTLASSLPVLLPLQAATKPSELTMAAKAIFLIGVLSRFI
jgi:hypothetical protein